MHMPTTVAGISLFAAAFAALLPLACAAPAQWFYSEDNYASRASLSGCTITRWNGTDPGGVSGYPWMSTIVCVDGHEFEDHGVTASGMLRFYLQSGTMEVNGDPVTGQGSSYWVSQGVAVRFKLSGAAHVVGGPFTLSRTVPAATFTSSFGSPPTRAYLVSDAISGTANATNVHDPHINNGTTHSFRAAARDLLWSSKTSVDPPSIVVLNCAPDHSYVLPHSHPAGALYIPFTGRICFQTDTTECTAAGYARWTSPNLYYYESFYKVDEDTPAMREADQLVGSAGMIDCKAPIVFAVTNFDPDDVFGQPNFVDAPANSRLGAENFTWGTFASLAVRTTTVTTQTVQLDTPA